MSLHGGRSRDTAWHPELSCYFWSEGTDYRGRVEEEALTLLIEWMSVELSPEREKGNLGVI